MRAGTRRGVALMLVLWLVVVLGAVSAGVVRATRSSVAIAGNSRAGLVARAAAESGIEAAVAAIEDTLAGLAGSADRRAWLNSVAARVGGDAMALGGARFAVTVVDVSARLDVNAATEAALRTFFSQFTDPPRAATIARSIRSRIEPQPGDSPAGLLAAATFRSLESLRTEGIVPADVLGRAAPYLTVDGDGSINQVTAPDTVRVAAAGELRDEPGRLLIVSRGWVSGHPLTCEIQAVYSIAGNRLVFSHWRERTL